MEAINKLIKDIDTKIRLLSNFKFENGEEILIFLTNTEEFMVKGVIKYNSYIRCDVGYNRSNSFCKFDGSNLDNLFTCNSSYEYYIYDALRDKLIINDRNQLTMIKVNDFVQSEIEKLQCVKNIYEDFITNPF